MVESLLFLDDVIAYHFVYKLNNPSIDFATIRIRLVVQFAKLFTLQFLQGKDTLRVQIQLHWTHYIGHHCASCCESYRPMVIKILHEFRHWIVVIRTSVSDIGREVFIVSLQYSLQVFISEVLISIQIDEIDQIITGMPYLST